MFAIITLILLGFLAIIVLRDEFHNQLFYRVRRKKILKKASQCIALRQWLKAEKILSLIEEKKDKEYILIKCQVLRGTQRLSEALLFINKGLDLHSFDLQLILEKAKILYDLGESACAFSLISQAEIILRSESDHIYYAAAALGAKKYEKAWEIIAPYVDIFQNTQAHIIAGTIFYEKQDYTKAIEFFTEALRYDEGNSDALIKLAHVYRKCRNFFEAESIFQSVLEKDQENIEAILGWGACYQERGKYLEALLLFQSSSIWEKKDPRILFQAGLMAMHTENYEHGADYFALLLGKTETAELLVYYAFCLEKIKNWSRAEQIYLHLLGSYPQNFHGYFSLAKLFGIGLSQSLSSEQALNFAYYAAELNPTPLSWEIVSACEARSGNYDRAHFIQEFLVARETKPIKRNRHFEAMRHLRKQLPLENYHLDHNLVA